MRVSEQALYSNVSFERKDGDFFDSNGLERRISWLRAPTKFLPGEKGCGEENSKKDVLSLSCHSDVTFLPRRFISIRVYFPTPS